MKKEIKHLDIGDMDGGLARMVQRFWEQGTLCGDPAEDEQISGDANAALLGLLYDQRVRAEYAFTGPQRLRDRLGHLDMGRIAAMDLDALRERFAETPAVHRFTNKMAEYTQRVAKIVADEYGGDAARIWNDGSDFATIRKRVEKLPGFGKQKAAKMKYVLHYFGFRDFSEDNG